MKKLLILIMVTVMLFSVSLMSACKSNSTHKSYSKEEIIVKLEENFYEVNVDDEEWILEWFSDYFLIFNINEIETFITAEHIKKDIVIHIAYCWSEEQAKYLEREIKESPANIYEEWDWNKSDFRCIRNKNVVYFGHKDAVNLVA